ncbi:hypothetical protein BKA81DRAFT_348828 [Phyllosticta paracitricarpa]
MIVQPACHHWSSHLRLAIPKQDLHLSPMPMRASSHTGCARPPLSGLDKKPYSCGGKDGPVEMRPELLRVVPHSPDESVQSGRLFRALLVDGTHLIRSGGDSSIAK